MKKSYKTEYEVLQRGKQAIGRPFYEIDTTNRLKTGKGGIGNFVEESWFGLQVNNKSAPDFKEAGVELKVIPYLYTSKGIRAKERLVCNIIDYMGEYKKTFEKSSFYLKCNTMLIMAYLHRDDVGKEEYKIDAAEIFKFPESDLPIIMKDWEIIINKI